MFSCFPDREIISEATKMILSVTVGSSHTLYLLDSVKRGGRLAGSLDNPKKMG